MNPISRFAHTRARRFAWSRCSTDSPAQTGTHRSSANPAAPVSTAAWTSRSRTARRWTHTRRGGFQNRTPDNACVSTSSVRKNLLDVFQFNQWCGCLHKIEKIHSYRSATIGSTRAPRAAREIKHASNATAIRRTAAAIKGSGGSGPIGNRMIAPQNSGRPQRRAGKIRLPAPIRPLAKSLAQHEPEHLAAVARPSAMRRADFTGSLREPCMK